MTKNKQQLPLHEPARAPIKFIPREQASIVVPSTRQLEAELARIKSDTHRKVMADEIRMMFRRYLREGYFKFHTELLEFIYGQYFARQLLGEIRRFTKVVKDAGRDCCRRVFLLPEIENPSCECTTYSDPVRYILYPTESSLTYRTISPDFLTYRYDKWSEFCEKNNLLNNVDFDGRTKWGAAMLETNRSLLVPLEAPEPAKERDYSSEETEAFKTHVQARLDRYQSGVCNVAVRRHGRAIHATTGTAREVRELTLIDGQETVEIDLHATYWALLIMMMEDCEERNILIQIYHASGFYSIFDFSVLPRGANEKVEVMKQCLFLNNNDSMPPLRQQLKSRFPKLDALICNLRAKHTPTGLSHILTELEGRAFVDMIVPKLHKLGCKPNYNYDGIIVPVSQEAIAREIMQKTLENYLGFKPKLKTKSRAQRKNETA